MFIAFLKRIFGIKNKYFLSACLIIKDDVEHIDEWIAYHTLVGVEHFYIYDNNSSDGLEKHLEPYIKSRLVTYKQFGIDPPQLGAYKDACISYSKESTWIAFIDADEFISSKSVVSILHKCKKVGLGLNWKTFGSSGHQRKPKGLQIEEYTMRAPKDFPVNLHLKLIVRPDFVLGFVNPHYFIFKNELKAVTVGGEIVDSPFSKTILHEPVCLHHYVVRSHEEALKKVNRGRATINAKRTLESVLAHDINEVRDDTLFAISDSVKKRILYLRSQ